MKYRVRDRRNGGLFNCTRYLDLDGNIRDHRTHKICPYSAVEMGLGIEYPCGTPMYEGDIVSIDKDRDGVYWSLEFGYFGDHKFYASDNINSGREVDEEFDGEFTFTVVEGDTRELRLLGNTYYDMDRKEIINLKLGDNDE